MKPRHLSAIPAGVLLVTSLAWGHHGFSSVFDLKTILTLQGKVTRVEWRNPHPYVYLNAVDNKGQVQAWSVEFSDLNKLNRVGLVRDSIKVDDQITITAFASKTGGEFSYLDTDSPDTATRARTNHFARASEVILSSGTKIAVP
jgi:hypothetical protein